MKHILKLILLCTVFLSVHFIANSQNKQAPYVPGELIVKFKEGKSSSKTNHLSTKMQARVLKTKPALGLEVWKVNLNNTNLNVLELVEQYKDHPDIEFIEPNYLYTTSNVDLPNDLLFHKQWALHNTNAVDIDAPEAWAIQSESPSIVVGILDTGVDWQHPDLIDNIWQNLGEDANNNGVVLVQDSLGNWIFDDENGIDDDGNGYVDDFIGWNFVDNNNQPFDYDAFENGEYVQSHGTHVAGIIGATGDNEIGISGVTQNVQLAPLKFLTDDLASQGTAWHAAEAIAYADSMGIQISNNSWGGSIFSTLIKDAIEDAGKNNHLFIAAAGNGGWDKIGDQATDFYPSNYDLDNIISVANTDNADELHQSSNYNIYNVDVAAPGTLIYSCLPSHSNTAQGMYGYNTGTSMAAPMVAGVCALVWEKNMELFGDTKVEFIKNLILENTDELPQLKGKINSGGRLNINKALSAIIDTLYTNQYTKCRVRDSLALIEIHEVLDLDFIEYGWHNSNSPINEWNGVLLNTLGCVTELFIMNTEKQEIPQAIGELKDLTSLSIMPDLSLFSSSVYDRMDEVKMDNFYNTYETVIEEDSFNVAIPLEIFNLKKLKHLNLSNNRIGGEIPEEIGELENLEYLGLSYNQLTGNIPIEISNLTKLKHLQLAFNKLSGVIPSELDQLENLHGLHLLYNELNGNIPISLGNINYLKNLDLGYNNLTGEIPVLAQFQGLKWFYVDSNQLTGTLDPALSWLLNDIERVAGFDVSYNDFEGCYDPAFKTIGHKVYDSPISEFKNHNISDGNRFIEPWEEFTANEEGSCWASITSKVWPGDTNNDGVVDVDDFVFYEAALNRTGDCRDNPQTTQVDESNNTFWEGQRALDWSSNVLGVNSKHQDANGDGIVDTLDYQVIEDNMGQENPDHRATGNLTFIDGGIKIALEYDKAGTIMHPNNLDTIEKFIFKLYVTNVDDGKPANLHNLSAKVAFNNEVKVESFEFINNCLDSLETEYFLSEDKTELKFYYKIKDNVNNNTCVDPLGRVTIIVQEELAIDGDEFLSFKVKESIHSLDGLTINETIPSASYSSLSISTIDDLQIELLTTPELCQEGGIAEAVVSGGQLPYNYNWLSNDDTLWIFDSMQKVDGLIAGDYLLIVTDGLGAEKEIPFIIEEQLEFDENGLPLDCETYIEIDCPDDLNLTDVIPQDAYNAAKHIYADGLITDGAEVEFRAGEYIRLTPGFKMESNTSLYLIIDDCQGDE